MIIKQKLKKIFHNHNVQVPISTLNILDDELTRIVTNWAKRAQDGNIKRLHPEDIYLIVGNAWSNLQKEK